MAWPARCASERVARAAWVLGAALLLARAAPAAADEATARFHDGGVVSGHVEVYEPGLRLVLRTASGERVERSVSEIAEIELVPSPVSVETRYVLVPRDTERPPGQLMPAPAVTLQEQPLPSLRRPLLIAGAGMLANLIGGHGMYAADSRAGRTLSLGLYTLGSAAMVVGGLVMLPLQVVRRVRTRRAARNEALRLRVGAHVDPALRHYGLASTLRF